MTTTRTATAEPMIEDLNPEQAALTGHQTVAGFLDMMKSLGCFQGPQNHLGYWPNMILWKTVRALTEAGYLTSVSGGPATYGHTDYFLAH